MLSLETLRWRAQGGWSGPAAEAPVVEKQCLRRARGRRRHLDGPWDALN